MKPYAILTRNRFMIALKKWIWLASVCACGSPGAGDVNDSDSADVSSDTLNDSASESESGSDTFEPLCDGSEDIRFYAMRKSPWEEFPGKQVITENGMYFVVYGTCRYVTFDWEGFAWAGTLDDDAQNEVETLFALGELADLAGTYVRAGCDLPDESYSFGASKVQVSSICGGDATGDADPVMFLGNALSTMIERSRTDGVGSTGDIRYFVVLDEMTTPDNVNYRNAPTWPLASNIADIAVTEVEAAEEYELGDGYLTKGADAGLLRELRTAFYAGEIGLIFIPIKEPDGTLYQLYMRDTTELEDADGLIRLKW